MKDEASLETMQSIVIAVHHLSIYTLDFLKAYLLYKYDQQHALPVINENLIKNIMTVLCEKTDKDKRSCASRLKKETQKLKARLGAFYEAHFRSIVPADTVFQSTNLLQVWTYFARDVVKDYENNIKQHFAAYVQRFVNVVCNKKQDMKSMASDEKAAFTKRLQKIKTQILERQAIEDRELAQCVTPHLASLLPQGRALENDSVYYDIKVHPQDYLPSMIYMMRWVEDTEQAIIYNVFPMRNKLVPGYIRLDTASITALLLPSGQLQVSKAKIRGAITQHKELVWCTLFKTGLKCFAPHHKQYTFDHQIQTDGVAVSIVWRDKDKHEGRKPPRGHQQQQQDDGCADDTYIDDVRSDSLRDKTLVGIDPNKGDLIYCSSLDYGASAAAIDCIMSDVDGKKAQRLKEAQYLKTFRYTQNQRRRESKTKIYAKRNDDLKKETKINGKTVKEMEAELSAFKFNRKLCISSGLCLT